MSADSGNIVLGEDMPDVLPFDRGFSLSEIRNHLDLFNMTDFNIDNFNDTSKECEIVHLNETLQFEKRKLIFCNAFFDSVSCWPPTAINSTAIVKCFSEFNGIQYDDSQKIDNAVSFISQPSLLYDCTINDQLEEILKENKLDTIQNTLTNLFMAMQDMKVSINQIKVGQDNLEIAIAALTPKPHSDFNINEWNVTLPIKNGEDFEKAENLLPQKSYILVNLLALVGGLTLRHNITLMVKKLLSKNIASQYSGHGRKGKKDFSKTKFLPVLIDNATKFCTSNGSWSRSEYSSCEEIIDHSHGVITTTTIYFVGYSLSLIALSIAIGIFLYFKDLRCLRNTIHTHLMCAYMLVYFMWILTLILELNFESHLACIVLIILLHYFHLTTFFWMFVEGLYLYILVVETLTRENFKLRVYIIIGWGVPILFVLIWAVVKSFLPPPSEIGITVEDANAGNLWLHCPWMRPHSVDWIHQGPTILVLLLNLIFLLAIMWVLITKLRSANTLETQQYRKAAKALLVLMPLLGVTYVLTIAGPSADGTTKYIFDYVRAVLLSTQGLTVALFYCFLNTEVQNTLKHRIETWRTNRSLGQRRLRFGSRSKDWSPRSRTESIRLYSQPTYHKRESCTSDMTTTTLITVNGGGRPINGGPNMRSPFLQPPRPSYPGPGNV